MKFSEKLNEYIEKLSCTAKELCALSGISPTSFLCIRDRCKRIVYCG